MRTLPLAEIELLHRLEIFAVLSAATLETLAREARPVGFPAGSVVVREGEAGDEFYAIRDGEVAVDRGGERLAIRGPGDGFGELALLFDVPLYRDRHRARARIELLAIGHEAFLRSRSPASRQRCTAWRRTSRRSITRSARGVRARTAGLDPDP